MDILLEGNFQLWKIDLNLFRGICHFLSINKSKLRLSGKGVGEGGAGGAVAPPMFESWGAQPLQFFTCYTRPLHNSPPLFSTCSYPSVWEHHGVCVKPCDDLVIKLFSLCFTSIAYLLQLCIVPQFSYIL